MILYLDESGDLGFTFKAHGKGSSRFLTIACLLIPKEKKHLLKRIVSKFYNRLNRSPENEIKGSELPYSNKIYFAKQVSNLLESHKDIKILAITTLKLRVMPHIRYDSNKLYNYMIGLMLLNKIKKYNEVLMIPDERSIKVKSGNSLADYLQIKMWFDEKGKRP